MPTTIESVDIKSNINITRYRTVNGIKFWHPHGDIRSHVSIVLSLRKYGMILPQIEVLRKHFKANERKNREKEEFYTWFDCIAKQPILIIGASISDLEWDIWFALANRKRNFAKRNFKKNEQPIFKMVGPCETLDKNWFTELTIRKETYPCQWERMQDLFNNYNL
jgi:hypothetical protein